MYSKEEGVLRKRNFWISFGRYMKPVPSSWQEDANWINYRTGIKNVALKMEVDSRRAVLEVYIREKDEERAALVYDQWKALRQVFFTMNGEAWHWKMTDSAPSKQGVLLQKELAPVSIYREEQWPDIISFLKPSLVAFDEFWGLVKEHFEVS